MIGPKCPTPRVVIPTIPDTLGCFRSVAISTSAARQTAVKDSTCFLNGPMLQVNESVQAVASRATTIQFMREHVDEYIGCEGEALYADMPQRPMFQFSSLAERINLMSSPTALVGEVEIMATNKVLKISINVSNTHYDTDFRNEPPICVQYTPIGEDTGHFESIVENLSPSHTDGGILESVPAQPLTTKCACTAPHNKVCLHRPLTTKCTCTAPSQQSVPAPPLHNKVCLHRPLTTKCACTAPSQQSVPAPPLTTKRHLNHVCRLY